MTVQGSRAESAQLDSAYQYPPDLMQLLIEAIPLLCPRKIDVLSFFRGAGVSRSFTGDLQRQLKRDRDSISKYAMVRSVLAQINEDGDRSLGARREVLKRVVEFEDFSACWPKDQAPARGYVAEIRALVNVKDSFTRMNQERQSEARKRGEASRVQIEEAQQRRELFDEIKHDFYGLFAITIPQERGSQLEDVLNRFFEASGVLIREAFGRTGASGTGIVEQIDGAIEIDGHIYLVEMKWHGQPIGVEEVSQHIVRVAGRADCRGIFVSESGYTGPAIEICKDALKDMVFVLVTLEEIIRLLERDGSFEDLLKTKIHSAMLDKNPHRIVLD